jgi:ABC-2 type transport system ATP-binding protein
MQTNQAIQVKGLKKSFKDLCVLNGIDLTVERGQIFALLGPNGAGKTTTVKILATLLQPDEGEVMVHGFDVVKQADEVSGVIGLTGQYAAVDEILNGYENLEMMGRLYHLSKADSKRRAQELLEQFDLVEAGKRAVKTYSGGMRRRLDLALSLIAIPPIIFLDEPTTGLDPRSRLAVWNIVKHLAETGTTVLLTTQYLEEADQLADKIAVIDGGKVIAVGTADELKQRVGKERIEIVIDEKSSFESAVRAINHQDAKVDEKRRSISIPTSGSIREVKEVFNSIEQAHVEIESFSLHKPTLDDVFLHLTGKHTQDNEEKESV